MVASVAPGMFPYELQVLRLYRNSLTEIPPYTFYDYRNMRVLSLFGNGITNVGRMAFPAEIASSQFSFEASLEMGGNPSTCAVARVSWYDDDDQNDAGSTIVCDCADGFEETSHNSQDQGW